MYEEDIEMAMEFNFDLVDRLTPDKVIEDKLKELVEVTKGYVEGKIEPYSGRIFSYDYTKRTGLANLNLYQNSEETVHVDIQDKLGEQNNEEKKFYEQVRQAHKLFEKSYEEYENLLLKKLSESENYFYSIRSLIEKILGYYNVGTDLCNNKFCRTLSFRSIRALFRARRASPRTARRRRTKRLCEYCPSQA